MKWVAFAVVTAVVWTLGIMASLFNAMMECFPHIPAFQECLSDKRGDALIIVIVTISLWIGLSYLVLHKRPTT